MARAEREPPPTPRYVTFAEVGSLASHASLPATVRAAARARAFDAWIRTRDRDIRRRVLRGEEDALVPLLLFGTTFTSAPRLTQAFFADLATRVRGRPDAAAETERVFATAFEQRTDDLLRALASPGGDPRLTWARDTLERAGHPLRTAADRAGAGRYVVETFARVTRESSALAAGLQAGAAAGEARTSVERAHAFAGRALAPDTGWPINFALAAALTALQSGGLLSPATPIRRVAIVGPGLDVIDKDEGFDLYPPQSLQPFAVVDALARLGLARPSAIEVLTLDVNPRVNDHLRLARTSRRPYMLHLIAPDRPWTAAAKSYWSGFGRGISSAIVDVDHPRGLPVDGVRAVRVEQPLLSRLTVLDSNIVCQRIDLPDSDKIDLVVATNVLLYYDAVDQPLAVSNIAHLLRPGGILLTNTRLAPIAPGLALAGETLTIFSSRPGDGETVYAYQRPRS